MELVHGTCAGYKALCKPIEDHEIVQVDEAFGGCHACVMGPRDCSDGPELCRGPSRLCENPLPDV